MKRARDVSLSAFFPRHDRCWRAKLIPLFTFLFVQDLKGCACVSPTVCGLLWSPE